MSAPIRTSRPEPCPACEIVPATAAVLAAIAVMAVMLIFSTLGCSDTEAPPPRADDPPSYRSDLPRDTAPDATAEDLAALARGDREFALALYRELDGRLPDPNLLLSPLSIRLAFAMVEAGARGETADQMRAALRCGLAPPRLYPACNALDLALTQRNRPATPEGDDAVELALACSFWGQVAYPFLPAYLDLLAVNFGAEVRALDFQALPDPSRLVINDWVAGRTRDRILDLLPGGSISDLTRAVLVSALYFKAPWADPFDPADTADGPFHREDGGIVTVPLMRHHTAGWYAEQGGVQALELPFREEELSMVFLLPAAGRFAEFAATLSAEQLERILADMREVEAELVLPRFTFRTAFTMRETLQAMGMVLAFGPQADFSGMVEDRSLCIDDAYHQAFIAVEEKGVEAAAATAVVIGETGVPEQVTFTADRPFLFLIRDRQTGALLFFGRLADPS